MLLLLLGCDCTAAAMHVPSQLCQDSDSRAFIIMAPLMLWSRDLKGSRVLSECLGSQPPVSLVLVRRMPCILCRPASIMRRALALI